MKRNKILITLFLVFGSLTLHSCITDWLNVTPRDHMLNKEMFSTEMNINNVLNGIYRSMAARGLYGELMTQTFTEHLARFYWHGSPVALNSDVSLWANVALFEYGEAPVRRRIQTIWNYTYALIFRLNAFIYNLEAVSDDVMMENRRRVLLGEAYALRAFLHFDMFRLFGPINMTDAHTGLPYNRSHQVMPHPNLPATEFIYLVLEDLAKALVLLEDDPIRTSGVNSNFGAITTDMTLTPEDISARFFRNRRMNYFAARALEARVLLHAGRRQEAANAAQMLIDQIYRTGTFRWEEARTDGQRTTIIQDRNFIFYREVLFGLDNIALHTTWQSLFEGTQLGRTHAVTFSQLRAVFGNFDGALSEVRDIRSRQWTMSNVNPHAITGVIAPPDTHISTRFRREDAERLRNFQPLMRMSELYYILAEVAIFNGRPSDAANAINRVQSMRGLIDLQLLDPATVTLGEVTARLDEEIYREFVGEGQIFFYLKRNNRSVIFDGNGGRTNLLLFFPSTEMVYVLPLPDSETMI